MKDFSSIIKAKLNTLFGATFTEETTESEMIDFIEQNEAVLSAKLSAVEEVTEEVKTAQSDLKEETTGSIQALTEAVNLLAQAQKANAEKMDKIEGAVKAVSVGLNNIPKQKTGDPVPETGSQKVDDKQFQSEPAAKAVLQAVKSIVPMS